MSAVKFVNAVNASLLANAFSGVVSVRRHEQVLFEVAAGFAERANRIPNNLETRFGIASGTKFFTALAIGRLIAEKKLDFSTKLADCVTLNFPHYAPGITIRHLLTHSSGIADYYDEDKITDFDTFTVSRPWYELKDPKDYLAVFPDEPMKFPPGERFSYSNGGYILLGVVIEALTGRRYQDFVEQEVFQPAGMQRSGFFGFDQLPENTAHGYIEQPGGWRTNIYNLPVVGASDGGAYTTLADVARLWKAFWGGELLPHPLVKEFTTPQVQVGAADEGRSYGYGLWLRAAGGGAPEVYFTGSDAGVSFRASVWRETGLQLTVISNTSEGAWPVCKELDKLIQEHPDWLV